ncbi:MAG: hypothetical protein AAGB31_05335 [Bdellovibrio sp.]
MLRRIGAILISLLFTLLSQAAPGSRCNTALSELYIPTQRLLKNNYVTSRGLAEYIRHLHPDFAKKLRSLGPNHHWVDLGAGKANAQIEFLKELSDLHLAPLATAVAFKLDRWWGPRHFQNKLQVKEGFFELQDISQWPSVDLITDFMGVISYSKNIGLSLQKAFDLLREGGEFYTYSSHLLIRIVNSSGHNLSLTDFLKTIPGLEVEGRYGVLKITKVSSQIQVPQTELIHYMDDAPPQLTFQIR